MENKNHQKQKPASSFTAELFGENDSQSSSTGIFSSIFPPPARAVSLLNIDLSYLKEDQNDVCWSSQPDPVHFKPYLWPFPSVPDHLVTSKLARNQSSSQFNGDTQKWALGNQVWTATRGTSAENVAKNTASANSSLMNMERRPIFQERVEPSPLGSSLYYGGQEDMYVCSSSNSTSQPYHKFKKLDGKDDPNHLHSASRGNWWQGSLYY